MITHPSAAPIDLIGAIEDRVFMLGETVSSSRSLLVSDGTVDNTRVLGLVVTATTRAEREHCEADADDDGGSSTPARPTGDRQDR